MLYRACLSWLYKEIPHLLRVYFEKLDSLLNEAIVTFEASVPLFVALQRGIVF